MSALVRILPWVLLLLAVVDWVGLKSGRLRHSPWILSVIVGTTMLLLVVRLLTLAWNSRTRDGKRWSRAGEALLVAGVLAALLAGTANWMLGLQGYVVLLEREAVPLHGGSHLQQFDGGPLARIDEMELVLLLEELEMVPAGPGHFYPRSHLAATRAGSRPIHVTVDRESSGKAGPLRFFQGAFGFAPRIVVLRDDEEVFDRVVPFTTERRGHAGISFEGEFTVESEGLRLVGAVDLDSLDEGMRGHATLDLAVSREGTLLGRGRLLPGHFAEVDRGYGVGFAGLEKWSEIDISRRHYGRYVLAGSAVAVLGALIWPMAAWRGR